MFKKILIANRGEIAIRIARAAGEEGAQCLAVFSEDDAACLHRRAADTAVPLRGQGAAAYLDSAQIIAAAHAAGCDAIHPGYGFLSESAAFADACATAGLAFIGPSPDALAALGDKARARQLAKEAGAPILAGLPAGASLADIAAFQHEIGGPIMLKAVAGGGGRGIRLVSGGDDLASAYERCRSEARQSFGEDAVYAEEYFPNARHIEVQIAGDGVRAVHIWDRECSLQRQRQKVVEIAPASFLAKSLRQELWDVSLKIAEKVNYRGLGTMEFLVAAHGGAEARFAFIEANARLQVEHTVTEAVTGLDLVRLQLRLAAGESLAKWRAPPPRGMALQARINLETLTASGEARPAGGVIAVYEPPSGPGVRVDGYGYAGYHTNPRFDSLLAKVIVSAPEDDFASLARKAGRVLKEFRLEGVSSNLPLLAALLAHEDVHAGRFDTDYVARHAADLVQSIAAPAPPQIAGPGARIDHGDPLAVLQHGKRGAAKPMAASSAAEDVPDGLLALRAPMQGTLQRFLVTENERVAAGQEIAIFEAMKMEHVILAPSAGLLVSRQVAPGDAVFENAVLALIELAPADRAETHSEAAIDLDRIRPDLAELQARRAKTRDSARPEAVARRRASGQRTARENIEQLCDPGSFLEYGALTVAARRRRSSLEELVEKTPADGLVMGFGSVGAAEFGEDASRIAALAYDYTVLAGTQGAYNHHKMDRMFELATRWRAPVVFFTEGGGGRPGDTEGGGPIRGFELLGKLSGNAPFIGVTSGKCFAGNASVLGCCDVIIAAKDSNIGMGGPAMIEGGGLGVYTPEEIGPLPVQERNGVIDIVVEDEAQGVRAAQHYLSFFQGVRKDWSCADQRLLRHAIPENRLRVYDSRALIRTLCDTDSVLELRPKFGPGMITCFARIEGRPIGLIANNPAHLGGAIDSNGADKAARLMQICEAYDIPVVSLSDTPGIMVGPDAEETALVRHAARMFVIGANLSVPLLAIVLRKSYGLGAIAMTGGSYQAALYSVSWPTGEFGGMGLEGSVKLGYRNELAAIEDPIARKARFDDMVARAYAAGKALNRATTFGIDDVIDPAHTRRWIVEGLKAAGRAPRREAKKLPWIDAW